MEEVRVLYDHIKAFFEAALKIKPAAFDRNEQRGKLWGHGEHGQHGWFWRERHVISWQNGR